MDIAQGGFTNQGQPIKKLMKKSPEIGAIVFECTNMPPFAAAVQKDTKLPVFDIVTMTRYVAAGLLQKTYEF